MHMAKLILVLGGARSGKSTYAQSLAHKVGGRDVLFVATAEAEDDEMRQRVAKHRRERPDGWRTLEAHRRVGSAILAQHENARSIVIDCLTLLLSNRLLEFDDAFAPEAEKAVIEEMVDLIDCAAQVEGTVIVVSNEVGMGLVPPYPLGRAYRDLLGKANQVLAQAADRVVLMIAGLPMVLKGDGQ
jgi:adenosylcobinamide kinase/adenosylcobinamide-phosphate guanylyltransferase